LDNNRYRIGYGSRPWRLIASSGRYPTSTIHRCREANDQPDTRTSISRHLRNAQSDAKSNPNGWNDELVVPPARANSGLRAGDIIPQLLEPAPLHAPGMVIAAFSRTFPKITEN